MHDACISQKEHAKSQRSINLVYYSVVGKTQSYLQPIPLTCCSKVDKAPKITDCLFGNDVTIAKLTTNASKRKSPLGKVVEQP
jgi:hypothetical protein